MIPSDVPAVDPGGEPRLHWPRLISGISPSNKPERQSGPPDHAVFENWPARERILSNLEVSGAELAQGSSSPRPRYGSQLFGSERLSSNVLAEQDLRRAAFQYPGGSSSDEHAATERPMAKWKKRLAVGSKVKFKLRSINIFGVTLEGIEVQVGPLMVPMLVLVDFYVRTR